MFVGIDLGGTSIKGILTDKHGKELSFREVPTPSRAKEIDSALYGIIEGLATSASISKIDITGVGIGSAGQIDRKRGMVISSPNIPALDNHPLARNMEKQTGIEYVLLENDATAALVGGWWKGNGSRFRNWIMVTLGTGIGGGIIIDGRIFTGQTGSSMEIGHVSIDHQGRECTCGNRGCLERYAAASALLADAKKRLETGEESILQEEYKNKTLSAESIFNAAAKKDALARELVRDTGTWLGYGVVTLINLFNPEAIIFGGGMSSSLKQLLPPMEKVIKERALTGMKENVKLLPIKDQSRIPALGAVTMVMDSFRSH
jgi:glucokinase